MEWTNRGDNQPPQQPTAVGPALTPVAPGRRPTNARTGRFNNGLRLASALLLVSAAVLALAVLFFASFGRKDPSLSEARFVNAKQMQAVFLNGGQVYFGRIVNLNDKFLRLNEIYYLRVNQQVQPDPKTGQQAQNDISLVKLGCELHGPTDSMVINRSQVIFWENIRDNGQVVTAIAKNKKDNPQNADGQKCEQPSPSSSQSGTGGSPPTPSTPTTPTTPPTTPGTRR